MGRIIGHMDRSLDLVSVTCPGGLMASYGPIFATHVGPRANLDVDHHSTPEQGWLARPHPPHDAALSWTA